MGKKVQFDRQDALVKARDLFWEKGYHGTSMRALQDALNLRPGSIYSAFGSKDSLFLQAIAHYANDTENLIQASIAQSQTKLEALRLIMQKVVLDNQSSAPSGICMLVKSITELTEKGEPLLFARTQYHLHQIEKSLAQIFNQAINQGEITSSKTPTELAQFFQIQLYGLRTFLQVTKNLAQTEKFIYQLFYQTTYLFQIK